MVQKIKTILTTADSFAAAESASSEKTLVVIEISKRDILARNTASTIEKLLLLTDEKARVVRYRESLVFQVRGFDDDKRELPEIEQARAFFKYVFQQWPYPLWYMALGQGALGLLFSLLCKVDVIRLPGAAHHFATSFRDMDEVEREFNRLAMGIVPLLQTFELTDKFDSCIESTLRDLFGPDK